MNNLLKNLLIGLLLPNLALGQTVALSTAAGDEERQPMSASVTNNSSARPQTSAKAKAWTSVAVSIVSVGVALFALGYAVTVRSENHSLAARGEEKDNELHNLSLEIKKGRTTQQQELETKNTELQQLKDRFTALEDAHKQSLAECQKLNDLYSTQTKSFKSLDSAYKELVTVHGGE
jgi:hypothetical protein